MGAVSRDLSGAGGDRQAPADARPGRRPTAWLWTGGLLVLGAGLAVLSFHEGFRLAEAVGSGFARFAILCGIALVAEYVDSSLGMGYGTVLTPLLLLLGFPPLQIVPAILLSEFATGVCAGGMHHLHGNVDLGRGSHAARVMLVLAACSMVGTVVAILLAVSLPGFFLELYIGLMILAIGVYILAAGSRRHPFSWGRILGLGTIAAFNKGISGGGYGPLVTGGQILSGIPEKNAVGVTSMAEGLVCLLGFVLYLILRGPPDLDLALPLVLGGLLSVPAASWTVKVLPVRLLRRSIGFATVFLGLLTLVRLLP